MSDLISRQVAIDTVEFGVTYAKAINKSTGEVKELFKEGNKALNEAVERLKELPSAQPDSKELSSTHKSLDTISRQAAIDEVHGAIYEFFDICDDDEESPMTYLDNKLLEINKAISGRIKSLPSAQPEWNNHTVACLLAEMFGDDCACNFNGIDEWLPEKCEVFDSCPNPVGVACWEQFLKHRAGRRTDEEIH